MAYKFTRLYIGDVVATATVGTFVFKKLNKALSQVQTPTISLDGDILTISDESNLATSFDIYVDGEVVETVSAVTTTSALDEAVLDEMILE